VEHEALAADLDGGDAFGGGEGLDAARPVFGKSVSEKIHSCQSVGD
jgi:hypothetical protein